jgi:hypothetical protein
VNRLLCILFLLPLPACFNPRYGHLDIELHSAPPVPVHVNSERVELPVGVAIAIDVAPISGNDYEYFKEDEVELDAEDRKVLRVDPTENPRRFVLTGVSVGDTCVTVRVLGEEHECIDASVLPSP